MRIGYFGGSFDPPHLGHLAVARAARERFGLNRVLLAPTGRQPLKPDGPSASFEDRLAMVTLLCAGEPGMEASSIDAPRPDGSPNYTADTLARLRDTLPENALLFAIAGADAFLGLPKWRNSAALFELADWIVVSRPGISLERLEELRLSPQQRARVHLLGDLADTTSATGLRERLRTQEPCHDVLPTALCAYIRERSLYAR